MRTTKGVVVAIDYRKMYEQDTDTKVLLGICMEVKYQKWVNHKKA